MKVDSIQNGMVIDHITAGRAMKLYELLGLDRLDCPVAIMKNVTSQKLGRKDIIKIDADIPVNLDVIGFVEPEATVNRIRDGVLVGKEQIQMPKTLVNVVKCKNPRCISSTEQELPHIFDLTDHKHKIYRCRYCEAQAKV